MLLPVADELKVNRNRNHGERERGERLVFLFTFIRTDRSRLLVVASHKSSWTCLTESPSDLPIRMDPRIHFGVRRTTISRLFSLR